MWYQVTLPYACFGICVENDIVKRTAPIGSWMIGRDILYISQWINEKQGKIVELLF